MHLGHARIPCGCQQRKEIMFEQGQPDKVVAIIAATAAVALVAAILLKVK